MRPRVAVLLSDSTREMVLSSAAEERLAEVADVTYAKGEPGSWELAELVRDAVACLTGWGTPGLPAGLFEARPELRMVAHTAGSVRRLVPQDLVGHRIVVCQSAAVIAESVAELVILQMLSSLRELHLHDAGLRAGEPWPVLRERHPGRLLGAQTVGVVGASRTGEAVIRLLLAFGCRVLVVDPMRDDTWANEHGVELASLPTLLESADVVTLHVPLLPETEHLIGAAELARLRDGALLVNSARGGLVEPEALLAELRSGRIRAALDVFPREPLAVDDEWRTVPGTLISPHAAGHTLESHRKQGDAMVGEIRRFLAGEPLQYEVTAEMVTVLA